MFGDGQPRSLCLAPTDLGESEETIPPADAALISAMDLVCLWADSDEILRGWRSKVDFLIGPPHPQARELRLSSEPTTDGRPLNGAYLLALRDRAIRTRPGDGRAPAIEELGTIWMEVGVGPESSRRSRPKM